VQPVNSFIIMKSLYEPFVRQGNPIIEMNPESSEVTKYAANSYLAMRITYMTNWVIFAKK
jgi:UDPglucose 6-dehydrogenase